MTVIEAARKIVQAGLHQVEASHLSALEKALKEHDAQQARHSRRTHVRFTRCLHVRGRDANNRMVRGVVEPGDKARVVGFTRQGLLIESCDPSKLRWHIIYDNERLTWEYCND